jgi:uncharacterized protein (TIGR03067 family)
MFAGVILVLACSLAAETAPDAAADLKSLAGVWVLESYTLNGESPQPVPRLKLRVEGETLRVTIDDNPFGDPNRLKLGVEFTPRIIDFVNETQKITREGIYRIEGDTLTLCVNMEPSSKERPGEFAAPADAGEKRLLLVLKRSKE